MVNIILGEILTANLVLIVLITAFWMNNLLKKVLKCLLHLKMMVMKG